ncbi:MAG TPA: phosphatase PAP2 family protein [Solirubrobacteraceae bacterium]|nr:phosphatase PAP2 family protein [Solirubrobacteraceae bacterium]
MLGAAVFLVLLVVLAGRPYAPLDLAVQAGVDELRAPIPVTVAQVATQAGASWVTGAVALVAVVVLVRRGRTTTAGVIAVGAIITFVAVQLAKLTLDRERPSLADILVVADLGSYPSGHAAYVTVWVVIAVTLGRGRSAVVIAAVALAILVGLSRLYLRAHWLSDVLGGWGLGAAIFALCALAGAGVLRMREDAASATHRL